MAHHELEGRFKIAVPDTDAYDLMDLVLGVVFEGKTSRGKLNLSHSMIGGGYPERVTRDRLVQRVFDTSGKWVIRPSVYESQRAPKGSRRAIITSASPNQHVNLEYFRVSETEVGSGVYEVSIMGGRRTPLGARVREQFTQAFGLVE